MGLLCWVWPFVSYIRSVLGQFNQLDSRVAVAAVARTHGWFSLVLSLTDSSSVVFLDSRQICLELCRDHLLSSLPCSQFGSIADATGLAKVVFKALVLKIKSGKVWNFLNVFFNFHHFFGKLSLSCFLKSVWLNQQFYDGTACVLV